MPREKCINGVALDGRVFDHQIYCPRCWEFFADSNQRDSHISTATCQIRTRPEFEGISDHQKRRLAQRSSSGSGEVDKWFYIWDVVFPGEERPSSPYLGSELEEVIMTVQGFWKQHKTTIVSNVLSEENGMSFQTHDMNNMNAELNTANLTHLMDAVLLEFGKTSKELAFSHTMPYILDSLPSTRSTSPGAFSLSHNRGLSKASLSITAPLTPLGAFPQQEESILHFESPIAASPASNTDRIVGDLEENHENLQSNEWAGIDSEQLFSFLELTEDR